MRIGGTLKIEKAKKNRKVNPRVAPSVESMVNGIPVVSYMDRGRDWLVILTKYESRDERRHTMRQWLAGLGIPCERAAEYAAAKAMIKRIRTKLCSLPPSAIEQYPEDKREAIKRFRTLMIRRSGQDSRYLPCVKKIAQSEGRTIPPTGWTPRPLDMKWGICPRCGHRFNLKPKSIGGELMVRCSRCRTKVKVTTKT